MAINWDDINSKIDFLFGSFKNMDFKKEKEEGNEDEEKENK